MTFTMLCVFSVAYLVFFFAIAADCMTDFRYTHVLKWFIYGPALVLLGLLVCMALACAWAEYLAY